uniref:E3 ubiquitin-protein ligase n=1 Tax=Pygocentrus nattereri TaxID=42514 RepID=A0AAR2LK17_PYGNA
MEQVYQHLARYVPKIYCLGPNLNPQSEDLLAQLLLQAPLEWYLCGEEPSLGLAKLEQSNQPSQLCGHVFKVGEPTYSCRECAADPTCVLCMQCFLGSVHKEHRYRMTTSGGGGFCDCGDTEAWKKGPYCQKHEPNIRQIKLNGLEVVTPLSLFFFFRERGDTYYCMLFNDEVHTYEQVIYTLQKAVNCTQKEAVSFATTVDRDVISCVKSHYTVFLFLQRNTSRQTKPLRVQVMHSSVVAHQCFALKALNWLGQIIRYSDALRRILCQVGLQKGPEGENSSLVDTLMLCDSKMWKGARNIYHQLFMSSLLMDLKYKKQFAIQFAKNYERLQSDYVKDDHDREFSITDLSVQIFTVPSLARMLITEENLMTTIIRTFLDHLRHRDLQGRFQFERYTAQQAFKFRRVQSLIGDLKYVLISCPTEWTDKLREKFLEGLDAFLELLKCMQGMDPVVRQVGQHIEMEPEWEAAFTLQMKLTHIISMMQEWCASDERVLIEAYKKCLTALTHCHSGFTDGEQPITLSMCGHSVDTIRYCVSQEKVSIHLPVSRLLAGETWALDVYSVRKSAISDLCSPPQSELSPPMLIEHPLRCLVLCAQVHAGMWRRNGFSLVNQIYYYHNVKCRVEMFDKDLMMLQAGASMMDPNHFLMIVLSRFELFHIFSSDVVQQNSTLIEEMLHLIIMVVGERFAPGIGQVENCDELKREIVHQLCIRPMAHSELVKALPENENKETGMERVIDSVALFKKPGVTGRGLYELRPECAKQFNLYFHHYSRADQSKVHTTLMLILLFIVCVCAPALPPPVLPPFCQLFASLVNILQCDVLLGMLGAVLQWAVEPSGGHWSESMLQRVLHLIGMALLEEQQQLESNSEDNEVTFNFTLKISRKLYICMYIILALLETLQNAPHLEVHKDMIRWILKVNCIYIIFTVRDKDKAERKRKAEMARLRREKIMAQMSEMQRHFINENKELFQQSLEELDASTSASQEHSALVCVGPRRWRAGGSERRQVVTCILCQEEQEIRPDGRAMVLAAFVQRSTVMSKNRRRPPHNPGEHYDPLFMHPDLSFGTHTGSCGHIMHSHCWQRYFEAVQAKEQRRQQRLRVHTSYDVENGEFLCPLCECLSNTVIPLLPLTKTSCRYLCMHTHSSHTSVSFNISLCAPYWVLNKTLTESVVRNPYSSSIKEMLTTFGTATYKVGLKVHPNEQDPRVPIMCWGSCAYTIQSIGQSTHTSVKNYRKVYTAKFILRKTGYIEGWHLWRCVKTGILPFLRGAALFFHHLNGVPAPPELQGEWEALCAYLCLPSNLLQLYYNHKEVLEPLLQWWCSHPVVHQCLQTPKTLISYPRESNRLIELPEDYSALINQASSFTCPKSGGDKSRAPTLCLVCGTMLCSQSYCCQTELEGEDVGACTAHTFACGAGVGIFLRLERLSLVKGCFYAPPYLDDYGETDQGLRRGNPLHLCRERYRKIQKLWRQHSITEEIGHAQEANQTLVGIDWQHL